MSWEYRALRRQLGLPESEWSALFEDFCSDVAPTTTGRLEWSIRRAPERLLTDRFVWSGENSIAIARSLERLGQEGWFVSDRMQATPEELRCAREDWSTAISLGYTPGDESVGERPGLKLYLTLSLHVRRLAWPWIRRLRPSLPESPPPRDVGLIVAFADDQEGAVQPRLYLLCEKGEVSSYLETWLSPELLELGSRHIRSGVVVREGGADCFGCAFQPAGVDTPDADAPYSPLLPPILETIRDCPPAWERLGRLTWATYALRGDACPPAEPPRNLYFLIR